MYNVLNTGTAVTITTTNNLLQDAFPTEASYFSINSSVFVAVSSSAKRILNLTDIANYNPLLQTPKQFLDALLTAGGGGGTTLSNLEKLKTQANDLTIIYTWLDAATSDQRIDNIEYRSAALGLVVIETFTYLGGAGTYYVTSSTLS